MRFLSTNVFFISCRQETLIRQREEETFVKFDLQKKILYTLLFLTGAFSAFALPVFAAGSGSDTSLIMPSNLSIIYGITTVLSFILAAGYYSFIKKKVPGMMLLYISVLLVNFGYFSLSISKALEEALLANRIAYLGSVFLPLFMLYIIMNACRVPLKKGFAFLLLCVSISVFILAASPGYLDLYYADVSLVFINGMAKLDKVYGPLHVVYLIYLITYFLIMIGVILLSVIQKRTHSQKHALMLLAIVFLNIDVWLIEQQVRLDFEFLSLSYIVSEIALLLLHIKLRAPEVLLDPASNSAIAALTVHTAENCEYINTSINTSSIEIEDDLLEETIEQGRGLALTDARISQIMETWPKEFSLTARESDVFCEILQNKKRKDIASDLNVTEHTVKKHTRSIFSKLDVASRADLFEKIELETTTI